MAMDQPEAALTAYQENLQWYPNRFNGIYGAAVAAKEIGQDEMAGIYFNQLIELTKDSTSERLEIVAAKNFVKQP
jgi:hypothetical protein